MSELIWSSVMPKNYVKFVRFKKVNFSTISNIGNKLEIFFSTEFDLDKFHCIFREEKIKDKLRYMFCMTDLVYSIFRWMRYGMSCPSRQATITTACIIPTTSHMFHRYFILRIAEFYITNFSEMLRKHWRGGTLFYCV